MLLTQSIHGPKKGTQRGPWAAPSVQVALHERNREKCAEVAVNAGRGGGGPAAADVYFATVSVVFFAVWMPASVSERFQLQCNNLRRPIPQWDISSVLYHVGSVLNIACQVQQFSHTRPDMAWAHEQMAGTFGGYAET